MLGDNGTSSLSNTSGSTAARDNSSSYTVPINAWIGVLTIAINSFVIVLFACRSNLRATPSNRILLSIALRDLLHGLLIFVHIAIELVEVLRRSSNTQALIFRIFIDLITNGNQLTAVAHLCLIAYDRFLSIFHALRYEDMMTKGRIKMILPTIWIGSYAVSFIQLTWLHRIMSSNPTGDDWKLVGKIEPWYSACVLVALILLPLAVVLLAYALMFTEIKRIVNYNSHDRNRQARQKQQDRVFYIFFSIYVAFALFSLPIFITRLVIDINVIYDQHHNIDRVYLNVMYMLSNLASVSTPLLYTLYKQDFRQAVKAVGTSALRLLTGKTRLRGNGRHDDFLRFSHTSEMSMSRDQSSSFSTMLGGRPSPKERSDKLNAINNGVELTPVRGSAPGS